MGVSGRYHGPGLPVVRAMGKSARSKSQVEFSIGWKYVPCLMM